MEKMKPFIFFMIIMGILSSPLSRAQPGGGSVGNINQSGIRIDLANGGLGVQCEEKSLVTFDFFEASQTGKSNLISLNEKILDTIRIRLKEISPEISVEFDQNLIGNGTFEHWDYNGERRSFDSFVDPDLDLSHCKIIQLSFFMKKGPPKRTLKNIDSLNLIQKRILEAHEALFQVGVRNYHHHASVLTRKLLAALLVQKDWKVSAVPLVQIFKNAFKTESSEKKGVYKRIGRWGDPNIPCPSGILFQPTGGFGSQITEIWTDDGPWTLRQFRLQASSRQTIQRLERNGQLFTYHSGAPTAQQQLGNFITLSTYSEDGKEVELHGYTGYNSSPEAPIIYSTQKVKTGSKSTKYFTAFYNRHNRGHHRVGHYLAQNIFGCAYELYTQNDAFLDDLLFSEDCSEDALPQKFLQLLGPLLQDEK